MKGRKGANQRRGREGRRGCTEHLGSKMSSRPGLERTVTVSQLKVATRALPTGETMPMISAASEPRPSGPSRPNPHQPRAGLGRGRGFPSLTRVRPMPGGAWGPPPPPPPPVAGEPQARATRSPGPGPGLDGDVEAGRPTDRRPKAAVCWAGGGAQPQPHRAPGGRHRAGPGWRRARPRPGAVGHGAPRVAGRGAPGLVEGERGGVPAPLPLQRRAARRLPQVRAGRGLGTRSPDGVGGRRAAARRRPAAWTRGPGIGTAPLSIPCGPLGAVGHLCGPQRAVPMFFTFSWGYRPARCSFVVRSPGPRGFPDWTRRRGGMQQRVWRKGIKSSLER